MQSASTQTGSAPTPMPPGNTSTVLHTNHTAGVASLLELDRFPKRSKILELLNLVRSAVFTDEEITKAWFDATGIVKTYSDKRVELWKGEIDNYLIFAGIFSAILTAFNVACFSLLQPPTTLADNLLRYLSLQQSKVSAKPPFISFSQPPSSVFDTVLATMTSSRAVPFSAVLLNILLFSSLMLSLCSAFIGVLVLQWLKTFSSELPGDSRLTAWLRQKRLNSLDEWHVEHFVGTVPLTLQISLLLFLAGLLTFLWTLNSLVFAIVCGLAVALTSIFCGTTILPLLQPTCAYLSPQTFGLYLIWSYAWRAMRALLRMLFAKPKQSADHPSTTSPSTTPTNTAPLESSNVQPSATTRGSSSSQSGRCQWTKIMRPLTAIGSTDVGTWQDRELSTLKNAQLRRQLDIDILHTAYNTTLDPNTLAIAAACLIRGDARDIVNWFRRLDNSVGSDVEKAVGLGITTSFTLSGHGSQAVLWAIVLQSMFEWRPQDSDEKGSENDSGSKYIEATWKRAVSALTERLSSAYRNGHFRLGKPQLDWVACVIFCMLWPEVTETGSNKNENPQHLETALKENEDNRKAKSPRPPPIALPVKDNDLAITGLVDAFHELLHHILAMTRSSQHEADVISLDVAQYAAILAFYRLNIRTPTDNSGQGPSVRVEEWFSSACLTVDLVALLSQISPTKMSDGPLSQEQSERDSGGFSSDRPEPLNRQQFLALRKHALSCLNTGLSFYADPKRYNSTKVNWNASDLLVVVPHLFQILGDHAPLFGPQMPRDLPDNMSKFNDTFVMALKQAGRPGVIAPLSTLLKYTLARIQIVNYSGRTGQ